eukprot:6873159-Prymnesium_polylepis.1
MYAQSTRREAIELEASNWEQRAYRYFGCPGPALALGRLAGECCVRPLRTESGRVDSLFTRCRVVTGVT